MRFEGFADTKCTFFHRLAKNQNKDWFTAHKAEYEDGWQHPMEALLAEARDKLEAAYKHLDLGEPKVMRIYRDVRFSKDKSPYKTNVGGGVPVKVGSAGKWEAPSALYVHIGVQKGHDLFAGAGSYMPDPDRLARMRKAMLDDKRGGELSRLTRALEKKGHRFTAAETLKKPPKGVDLDHPRIEFLKMKGLVVVYPEFPRAKLASRALLDWIVKQSRDAAPLVEWLAYAMA
jgi:uncharacterized protein (TIGR02453 family)